MTIDKDNKILVKVKNQFGNKRIFPVTHVEQLTTLTGQKTLGAEHIKALKELGFQIAVKPSDMEAI